uniref:Uncharacterized protein n=1 Tax=Megaselia scalaris TaxID=36166 RepID=T1GMM7_MEGSC
MTLLLHDVKTLFFEFPTGLILYLHAETNFGSGIIGMIAGYIYHNLKLKNYDLGSFYVIKNNVLSVTENVIFETWRERERHTRSKDLLDGVDTSKCVRLNEKDHLED